MPRRGVRKLKIGRADPHIWTVGEIRRFLLNAGDDWRPLFLVALFAGLRLGEIQALACDRQNRPMFATRKIEVRSAYNERTGVLGRPKSDTSLRAVDMVQSVHHVLLAPSARTATGLVFHGPGGKPLAAWMLYDHGLRPAIKRAEVNRIRFHDLRHTYASLLIMAGKHPKYIADQMGHASAAFTLDTYGHLMGRLPVQPVEWIDDLVFPEGLEAALKLHLFGAPNGATGGHPLPPAEGEERDRDRAQQIRPGAVPRHPVPQNVTDGGAGVLVGLAVFKTADGPDGSWWVRFPLPSATLTLATQGVAHALSGFGAIVAPSNRF